MKSVSAAVAIFSILLVGSEALCQYEKPMLDLIPLLADINVAPINPGPKAEISNIKVTGVNSTTVERMDCSSGPVSFISNVTLRAAQTCVNADVKFDQLAMFGVILDGTGTAKVCLDNVLLTCAGKVSMNDVAHILQEIVGLEVITSKISVKLTGLKDSEEMNQFFIDNSAVATDETNKAFAALIAQYLPEIIAYVNNLLSQFN